jgi:hypothetical protein
MQFFIFFVASFSALAVLYQVRWLLFLIAVASFAGLVLPQYLVKYFYRFGIFSNVVETSDAARENKVREFMATLFFLSAVFFSRYLPWIYGSIGLVFGIFVLRYSETIHELVRTGGRGDSMIKLVGMGFVIASIGWMSGITQAFLLMFLDFGSWR